MASSRSSVGGAQLLKYVPSMHRAHLQKVCAAFTRLVDRRRARAASAPDGARLALLLGWEEQQSEYLTDTVSEFQRPEHNFRYVTGVTDAGCAALVDLRAESVTLLIPRQSTSYAVWHGAVLPGAAYRERYGLADVRYRDELDAVLRAHGHGTVYMLPAMRGVVADPLHDTEGAHAFVVNRDAGLLLRAFAVARTVKTPEEVATLRAVCELSSAAHVALFTHVRSGQTEEDLELVFRAACMGRGCREQAYSPIVASGSNAAVLHYTYGQRTVADGELVLVDAGAMHPMGYCADITRVFPVNGRFSPTQRAVYEAVLRVQARTMAAVRPGITNGEVHLLSVLETARELLALGILVGGTPEELVACGAPFVFYPHGVGHMLGLSVHDLSLTEVRRRCAAGRASQPSPAGPAPAARGARTSACAGTPDSDSDARAPAPALSFLDAALRLPVPYHACLRFNDPLEAGNVITVEPGIYFIDALLAEARATPRVAAHIDFDVVARYAGVGGVRIEDDVLVSADGHECLSTAPKMVEEIERLMAGARTSAGG